MRKGWYDRKEIGRVTEDWVKENCTITDREMDLLHIINDRKLVRRDHLEIICDGYRYLSEKSRAKVLNRSINKLFNCMVLDKVHQKQAIGKGNKPAVVALDKAGSILLSIPHKRRIRHVKSVIRGKEYIFRELPPNFRHINGINQLEVDMIKFAHTLDDKDVGWLWRLENENHYQFYYNQEKMTVIPDVLFKFQCYGKMYSAYVEYDTGTEDKRMKKDFPTLKEKIIKYKRLYKSGQWEKDSKHFPRLFFITEDKKRVDWFNRRLYVEGFQNGSCAIHVDDWIPLLEKNVKEMKL